MELFENQKKQCLEKIDRSVEGRIDEGVMGLVSLLNRSDDYFTTSSCSGRVVLLLRRGSKHESRWLFKSHDAVDASLMGLKLSSVRKEVGYDDVVWLMAEPFILHVCCRSLAHASALLSVARKAGLKRSGIISMKSKIVVEMIGPESLRVPVIAQSRILGDKPCLDFLVSVSNRILADTKARIGLLERKILFLLEKDDVSV